MLVSVESDQLRASITATRTHLKGTIRSLRGLLQFLSDLEERFDALENAQPEEAQRDTNSNRARVAA